MQQASPGHLLGLGQSHDFQQRRADVGQRAAFPQRPALVLAVEDDQGNVADRVRRVRAVGRAVDHLLEVPVVGGDDRCAAHALDLVEDFADALVHRLGGLDRGVQIARVAHHVRIGEVDDHHIVLVGIETLQHDVRHFIRAHLGFQIVRSHLGRRDDLPVFAFERLLIVVVKEERHVGVLLRLGAAELLESEGTPVGAEDVLHLRRFRERHRRRDRRIVFRHADEVHVRLDGPRELLELRIDERPRDLAGPVAPEVEEDDAVAVRDLCERFAVLRDDRSRLDEFVGYALVVAALDGLRGAVGLESFAEPQALIGLLHAVPATVAVHRIEAAHHGRDLADPDLGRLLLDVGQVAKAACGRRIPAVREGVDENVLQIVPLGQFEQAVEVPEERVHADVAAQAHEVHPAVVGLDEFDELEELLVLEKRAIADGERQPDRFLRNDPAGADVLVTHLAVAHGPVGQADPLAVGVDQAMGILGHEHVIHRDMRPLDGIVRVFVGVRIVTPAVTDD